MRTVPQNSRTWQSPHLSVSAAGHRLLLLHKLNKKPQRQTPEPRRHSRPQQRLKLTPLPLAPLRPL